MEQRNSSITLSVAGVECGRNHSIADLQAISALLTMATKVFAAAVGGHLFCCESEALRDDNPIAQVLIRGDVSAVDRENLPPIGSRVIDGRKFTYRLQPLGDLALHTCERCNVSTCPAHWNAQFAQAG